MFPVKLISCSGNIPWPPLRPDFPSNDYFLWGFLKSRVIENNAIIVDQLKQNIVQEINTIPRAICRRVFGNLLV